MASGPFNMHLNKIRFDRILWMLFLLVTALVLLSSVNRKLNSFADNTVVQILPLESGESLLDESSVRQNLLVAFGNTLEGTELADLEVERIERVLEEDPFVEDAEAYVGQHNVLHIRIKQREPILRILDNDGGNYYLDRSGARIPNSKIYTARVMVATGNIAPYTADFQEKRRNSLKDLLFLSQTILGDPVLASFIQQIHIDNTGDFILVPLVGDQKIVLGSVRKLEEKLNKLKIFYKEGMPYAGWRKYRTINLKYNGQVVCRR